MKYIVIATILIVQVLFSSAQKSTQYFDWNWKSTDATHARYYSIIEQKDGLWLRKDYFASTGRLQMDGAYMDPDFKTAHGEFHYYHANGILQAVGKYENGSREGLWLSYHYNGMMSDSAFHVKGNPVGNRKMWYPDGYLMDSVVWQPGGNGVMVSWFDNGVPAGAGRFVNFEQDGKWRYFYRNGETSSVEIYDHGKLVSRQYYTEKGLPITDTASTDRDASFPGGPKAWMKYLSKSVYFPDQYKFDTPGQAVVTVDWYIDEEGNITDPFVSIPLHPEFDKIALNAFHKAPKWIPARAHGRNVKSFHRQPITFSQEE
jgi:hypothetical protein